jgi:hypothetical protein
LGLECSIFISRRFRLAKILASCESRIEDQDIPSNRRDESALPTEEEPPLRPSR